MIEIADSLSYHLGAVIWRRTRRSATMFTRAHETLGVNVQLIYVHLFKDFRCPVGGVRVASWARIQRASDTPPLPNSPHCGQWRRRRCRSPTKLPAEMAHTLIQPGSPTAGGASNRRPCIREASVASPVIHASPELICFGTQEG